MKHCLAVLVFCCFLGRLAAQTMEAPAARIQLTDSIACTPVKDQGNSPTCWVFGTNSLFESDLLKQQGLEVNLSEMYIARYAYIDKIKAYLASGGKTYCEGGGQFHDVIRVAQRYGMMPEEAYNGRPGEQFSHNHTRLDSSIGRLLKKWIAAKIKKPGAIQLKQVNDTLDKYLGKVPASFSFHRKQYTPLSFAKEVMQYDDGYVELMSFANQPLYKKCLLNDRFNWAGDSLYNVTIEDLQQAVDSALAGGWSVGWEGDVTEPGFQFLLGYAAIKDTVSNNTAQQRLDDFASRKTERDHMLHLVGSGKDETGNKWYYLKNSWGTWFSHYRGFLYMSHDYFSLKTIVLLLNKKALPAGLRKKIGL